ncbi:MAG TPA: hypothetical protein VKB80_16475 [Kofleriaceae bacterium]|nr:hypothetical protein [Kofleriaceae bacterium]
MSETDGSRDRDEGQGDALSPREREGLEAWTVPDPPAGFADRVVSAGRGALADEAGPAAIAAPAASPGPRRRIAPWVVVAVAAAAALVLAQSRAPSGGGGQMAGSASPATRQSIRIGQRAVAVAEAGAALSWAIESGRATVAQSAGDVFYRVERGGTFEVETPHGSVRVTGTCFRVEVKPMKTPWQGVVGAAIGAAVMVTVYEGSVLFASRSGEERAVGAGQIAAAGERGVTVADARGGAASAMAGGPSASLPPAADASREELLRRDALQRDEIAQLRARLQGGGRVALGAPAPSGLGALGAKDPSGRPWFDPSKEDLVRFAKECRVRADMPPLYRSDPLRWGADQVEAAGLSDDQLTAVNRVFEQLQREVVSELRALYIEAIGDRERADDLSPEAMISELRGKSAPDEEGRVNQRLAQERAGLVAPPVDLSRASPLERFMRRRAGLGDETERRLAEVLGAARARELRGDRGWGWQQESVGCPGGDEEDVAR